MDRQKAERLSHCIALISAMEQKSEISRKELSDLTGISLMTVGKLCTIFDDAELTVTKKEDKSESGRRATRSSLSEALGCAVVNCSDAMHTCRIYDANGKITLSLTHASAVHVPLSDKVAQFLDYLAPALAEKNSKPHRIAMILPAASIWENGTVYPSSGDAPFDAAALLHSRFVEADVAVFSPASCLCAANEGDSCRASLVLGKSATMAYKTAPDVPYHYTATNLRPLRVDGNAFGERTDLLGAPDAVCLETLLCAYAALFPHEGIRLAIPADASGISKETATAICERTLGSDFCFAADYDEEINRGARILLLCRLLKKHIG